MPTEKEEQKHKMTVEEAGHMGGQRVRELVQEGKEKESEGRSSEEESPKKAAKEEEESDG